MRPTTTELLGDFRHCKKIEIREGHKSKPNVVIRKLAVLLFPFLPGALVPFFLFLCGKWNAEDGT
jgi:hypothetical protein